MPDEVLAALAVSEACEICEAPVLEEVATLSEGDSSSANDFFLFAA